MRNHALTWPRGDRYYRAFAKAWPDLRYAFYCRSFRRPNFRPTALIGAPVNNIPQEDLRPSIIKGCELVQQLVQARWPKQLKRCLPRFTRCEQAVSSCRDGKIRRATHREFTKLWTSCSLCHTQAGFIMRESFLPTWLSHCTLGGAVARSYWRRMAAIGAATGLCFRCHEMKSRLEAAAHSSLRDLQPRLYYESLAPTSNRRLRPEQWEFVASVLAARAALFLRCCLHHWRAVMLARAGTSRVLLLGCRECLHFHGCDTGVPLYVRPGTTKRKVLLRPVLQRLTEPEPQ